MRKSDAVFWPYVFLAFAVPGQFFLSQRENSWTLVPAFLFWGLALYGLRFVSNPGQKITTPIPPWGEVAALTAIFLVAVAFRFFRIDSFPCGISVDQAVTGLGGLEVQQGWRPVFDSPLFDFPCLIFYPAAAWFHFFTPTQSHLALFFIAFSLAAWPWIYWVFRQWAGPGPALLAVFFLAVARWDIYVDRWGTFYLWPGFFIYATLAFWLRGLSSGKTWAYLASGLFMGLGLYGYYSYRIFPFLMAGLALWEILRNPGVFRRDRLRWAGMALIFTALAFPLLWHWAQEPHFGQGYPQQQFIGRQVLQQKSLMPLVQNGLDFLAMFNRRGDLSPKQTIDSAPMLDSVTGALAFLGLAFAFFKREGRSSVYPLFLFAGLSLNNVLCTDPQNICHVLPLLPCITFWAGLALWRLANGWKGVMGSWRNVAVGLVLASASVLNYHQLFDVQAMGKDNPAVFDLGPTLVGKKIAEEGYQYDFVLRPNFGWHWTVQFLGHGRQGDFRNWDWPQDPVFAPVSPGKKGVCFVMAEGDQGVFNLLKSLYPEGQAETVKDSRGNILFCTLCVSHEDLLAEKGLQRIFSGRKPTNYPFFPKGLPGGQLVGRFSGKLFVRQSGPQYFWAGPGTEASWRIDGKPCPGQKPFFLVRGFHTLELGLRARAASQVRLFTRGPDGRDLELDSSLLTTLPLAQGLEADYFQPKADGKTLVYRQWDPLVNFTHRTDLALFNPPLSIRWSGKILIEREGLYDFLALTEPTDRAQVTLDGKALTPPGPVPTGSVTLDKGWHSIRLDFQMGDGYASAISLAWKKPGDEKYEIIPPQAFGPVEAAGVSASSP